VLAPTRLRESAANGTNGKAEPPVIPGGAPKAT
jgi:hypothetical protein